MCVNKQTSLISFIIGIVVSIYMYCYEKNSTLKMIALCWIWVTFMQLFEYFIWSNQTCNNTNKHSTKLAFLFNITQPIVVFLLLMNITNSSKYLASTIIFIYIMLILYFLNTSDYNCLIKNKNCSGLTYKWWTDFKYGGLLYVCTLITIILLLVKPIKLAIIIASYILISLLISMFIYSCNVASMWCLLVISFPIFLMIINKVWLKL